MLRLPSLVMILLFSGCVYARSCAERFLPPNSAGYSYVNYTGGRGRSYEEGYESIGALLAVPSRYDNRALFADLQFIRVEPGRFAGSWGLGYRQLLPVSGDLIGANVFYDFRHMLDRNVQQAGIGLEYFNCLFDFRLNTYLPIGRNQVFEEDGIFDYGDGYITRFEELQRPMWGMDVELGKHFSLGCRCCLYVGLGPYFYDTYEPACCGTALLGGLGKVKLTICSQLDVEFLFTYDRIFHGCPQGQIVWRIPFTCISSCVCPFLPRVERNPIPITTSSCKFNSNF